LRKQVVLLLLLCGLCQSVFGQGFYDPDTVHTIQLIFPQSNWDKILDSLYAAGNEDRLLGTAIIDGVQYDSVGVRYKGNSTYSPNRVKNPFNIKLDYVIEDQEIDGYGTLKLANCWMDPSFVREVLGYEIARKYMPASLANYANVWVNGARIGLYTSVQDVDNLFLRTYFGSDDNACFKGEFDGPPGTFVIWGYRGTDSANYTVLYELESDSGWAELIDFTDTLNNYTAAVESVLNVDRHLWMLAYDWLLVNLDAPINMAHNFYLYRDDAHRFNPIIWDLNMDFGAFTQLIGGGGNLSVSQMQQLDPYTYLTNSNYPIINKILSNTKYKKMYIAHMKTMLEENFSNNWYYTRGQELQAIIDSHVYADPYKLYTYTNFQTNLTSSAGNPQSVVGIAQLMNARVTYLNNRSDFQATQPTIASVTHTPSTVMVNAQVQFVATVSNATSVQLAVKDALTEPFQKVAMLDDGAHNDGALGDGVYGVSIQAGTSEIHYYIFAENASAAAFLPARAEFEDSVIAVQSSELVINEFLAQNGTTQADQDGEYDDWIEIYNGTDSAISLNGYYLTDTPSNLTKWTFPDTLILSKGYLIVWADEDDEQVGLHASFKLSASGESIVLSDPSPAAIDQVTFGAQTVDISTGRLPNGTGDFVTMTPTFRRMNGTSGLVINEFLASNVATQADQDGEFDDWVEFYNGSSSTVSLDGFYLSDKLTNPTKWTFPDTSVPAGGYLVVWADEDGEQVGLHANFKLSASGEAIILSDPSQVAVDQIEFGAQTDDISTGRLPNGTGEFVTMTPTFGAANQAAGCCEMMGNVDGSTDGLVGMGDLTVLIDNLFITLTPLECAEEGNLDVSADGFVGMGDLTILIDHLFITLAPLPACP
jgi:hypothetical protein